MGKRDWFMTGSKGGAEAEKTDIDADRRRAEAMDEMLSALIFMHRNVSYTSKEFAEAVDKELRKRIVWFRRHVRVVEREVNDKYTVQELEFDND